MMSLSDETLRLLDRYTQTHNAAAAAHALLKDMLRPYRDDPYLTYRYEHSLRVAKRGIQIADGEGWSSEPMMIACLLHDVGYPECHTPEDFSLHQEISAQIAEIFLNRIGYDKIVSGSICLAIFLHNLWDDVPANASPFELSVRNADDLDRFDVLRTYRNGSSIVGSGFICDRSAGQILHDCDQQLMKIEADSKHLCATKTAQMLWTYQLKEREEYFLQLQRQMKTTVEMEALLRSL